MNFTNFIIAVSGILAVHFFLNYLYVKLTKASPDTFGGPDAVSDMLFNQIGRTK